MALYPGERDALVRIGDTVTPKELRRMISYCRLEDILDRPTFCSLVERLLLLDEIGPGNLGLVDLMLRNAGRVDLAEALPVVNGMKRESAPAELPLPEHGRAAYGTPPGGHLPHERSSEAELHSRPPPPPLHISVGNPSTPFPGSGPASHNGTNFSHPYSTPSTATPSSTPDQQAQPPTHAHYNINHVEHFYYQPGYTPPDANPPPPYSPDTSHTTDVKSISQSLKKHLFNEYLKVVNVLNHPASSVPVDVNSLFCPMLLYRNRQNNRDGLRQPLESYRELLGDKNGNRHTRVMLKGKSASGKTTILRKITKDWLEGRLTVFEILIFLSVGDLQPHWTVGDAVVECLLPKDAKITPRQVDDVIYAMGKKVALLLDGCENSRVDIGCGTLPETPTRHPPIGDIVRFRQLQDLFVLIATRSHGAKEFCTQGDHSFLVYQHVELYGFSDQSIREYVQRFVHTEEKQRSLLTYLETNHLKELVHTPGFLEMLCHSWNTRRMSSTNPPAMLNMLFHNMLFGLHRHVPGTTQSPTRSTGPASTGGECKFPLIIPRLGKRAFDLLLKEERVFALSELKRGSGDEVEGGHWGEQDKVLDDCLRLGIIKYEDSIFQDLRNPVFSDDRLGSLRTSQSSEDEREEEDGLRSPVEQFVSFHSDHIHCYCAARHLRELARNNFPSFEKKMKKLLKLFPKVRRMTYVILFCFAEEFDNFNNNSGVDKTLNTKMGRSLLRELDKVMETRKQLIRDLPSEKTDIRISELRNWYSKLCLHLNFEAQVTNALNQELCRCLRGGCISLVGISEYTTRALEYFLKHSQVRRGSLAEGEAFTFQLQSLKIVFLGSDVSMTNMKEFSKHISGSTCFFRSLMSEYIDRPATELECLRRGIEKEFDGVRYARDLCEPKKSALLHYYQRIRRWHPHTNVLLPAIESVVMWQSSSLRELSLMLPDAEKEAWTRLFEGLKEGEFRALEKLDLSFCKLSPNQLRLLSKSFRQAGLIPSLKVLVLAGNKCTEDVVQSIRHLRNLTEVGLQDCGLMESSLYTLIQSLSHLEQLEAVDLRRNEFSDQNAKDLEALLKLRNLKLRGLKLSLNGVRKGNIRSLVSTIRKQERLEVLHLNHSPHPLELISSCKDVPYSLKNLVDLRLSGRLPCFEGEGANQAVDDECPLSLPRIKLSPETMKGWATNLKKLCKLETFSLLYCELDEANFVKLFNACNYLKTNQCLKLMRYSYAALKERPQNPSLVRILSNEKREDFLQLW